MNKNEDEKFKILIEKMEYFEDSFKREPENESLLGSFQDIFALVKEKDFSHEELQQIYTRLLLFQEMFANKKEQLKAYSANILKTEAKIGRYITNSKI